MRNTKLTDLSPKVVDEMFRSSHVQRALKDMANYTLKEDKEAACIISASQTGDKCYDFGAQITYGTSEDTMPLAKKETDNFGLGEPIFITHTHPNSEFPIFSETDIMARSMKGVSVIHPNKDIETLLFIQLYNSEWPQEISSTIEKFITYDNKGYPLEGNREKIIKTLKEHGNAAFLTFNYGNRVYTPDKRSIREFKSLIPAINATNRLNFSTGDCITSHREQ